LETEIRGLLRGLPASSPYMCELLLRRCNYCC